MYTRTHPCTQSNLFCAHVENKTLFKTYYRINIVIDLSITTQNVSVGPVGSLVLLWLCMWLCAQWRRMSGKAINTYAYCIY